MTGMRAARIAPWVAVAATAGGFAWAIWLDAMASGYAASPWVGVAWGVATFASSGVGLVLATRRASNPIGWLLLGNGLVLAAMGLADAFADYAVLAHPGALPGGAWAVLFSERAWPLLFVFVTAIAWVFPDGRLPWPRWRPSPSRRRRPRGAGRVAARGRALQRGVRQRLRAAAGGVGVDPRHPVPPLRPGGPGEPLRARPRCGRGIGARRGSSGCRCSGWRTRRCSSARRRRLPRRGRARAASPATVDRACSSRSPPSRSRSASR